MNRRTTFTAPAAWRLPWIAGGLLAPALMIAQLDRSRPPVPGPAPEVHLGDHASFTLDNGMRVIVVENHKLPMVSVQLRFDIPPVLQGDRTGYIDMVGELLTTGTAGEIGPRTRTRTKAQIDEEVDRLGASLSATNDGLYASCLKKNLNALLVLFEDVAQHPSFPPAEFEKVKTRFASSIMQRQDDADAIAEAVGRSITFSRAHPYGEVMTDKSLKNIGVKDVQGYYRHFFRPEKGYLVFVGDITESEAKSLAKEHFAGWEPAPSVATMNEDGSEQVEGIGTVRYMSQVRTASGERRVFLVDRPGAAQSVIRVVFPLNLQPKDMRTLSAQLMNTILGGGVFNARLMQNLREDKGWTYGIHSSLEPDRFNGSFSVAVSVRTAVTDSAITEILNELERMRSTPVTGAELELAKNHMAGNFARSLEDPRTIARFALNTYLNELPPDHYASYLKRLHALTAADVQVAASAFLHPDNAAILVIGDRKELYYKLEPLSMTTNPAVVELDEDGDLYEEELTPVIDRTAEQVVDAYIRAIGGREAITRIHDLRVVLETTMEQKPVTITKWFGLNGQFRSETYMEATKLQEVVLDGKRAVRRDPGGEEELMDIDLLDLQINAHPVPEIDLTRVADRIFLSGRTMIDERPVYKITMMTTAGTTVSDYYDVETGLKLRRVDQKFMFGRSLNIVTEYSDYKPVQGVLMPHTMLEGGGLAGGQLKLTVKAAVANAGTVAGFFDTMLPPVQDE